MYNGFGVSPGRSRGVITRPGSGTGPGAGHTGAGWPARARAAADVPVAGYAYAGPLSRFTAPGAASVEDGLADGGDGARCAATGVASRVAVRPSSREAAKVRGERREVIWYHLAGADPCFGNAHHRVRDSVIVHPCPLYMPASLQTRRHERHDDRSRGF